MVRNERIAVGLTSAALALGAGLGIASVASATTTDDQPERQFHDAVGLERRRARRRQGRARRAWAWWFRRHWWYRRRRAGRQARRGRGQGDGGAGRTSRRRAGRADAGLGGHCHQGSGERGDRRPLTRGGNAERQKKKSPGNRLVSRGLLLYALTGWRQAFASASSRPAAPASVPRTAADGSAVAEASSSAKGLPLRGAL